MIFLIVGFGNMGCRHAQSLMNIPNSKILVCDPSEENFKINLKKINADEKRFIYYNDIDSLPDNIEFAVIATNSDVRFSILKKLISKKINKFLLEKVVFQSENQFNETISLLEKNGAIALCNFVNRCYPTYLSLKNKIKSKTFKMIVSAADIRLGSNALHYIDLFKFLGGDEPFVISSDIYLNKKNNKRGKKYLEFLGNIFFKNKNGSELIISAHEDKPYNTEIIISDSQNTHLISESLGIHKIFNEKKILNKKFKTVFTSNLTEQVYSNLIKGKLILPTVKETKNSHLEFFKIINKKLKKSNQSKCPIT